jgi:hypothetical protein
MFSVTAIKRACAWVDAQVATHIIRASFLAAKFFRFVTIRETLAPGASAGVRGDAFGVFLLGN